jgi:hypothetical protein
MTVSMTAWRARSTASSAERVVSAHRILRRRVDHCRCGLGRLHGPNGPNGMHPRVLLAGVPHKRSEPTHAIRHLDLVTHWPLCFLLGFLDSWFLSSFFLSSFFSLFFVFFFWAIFFRFFFFRSFCFGRRAQSRPRWSFWIGLREMTREGPDGPHRQEDKRTRGQEDQGSRLNLENIH